MQNQSSRPPEASGTDTDNATCELIVQANADGSVGYQCNWIPGEDGLIGLASIFYKLLIENFSEDIFKEIKDECVSNNSEADYATVVNLINNHAQNAMASNTNGNNVVVPPDQVFNV